MGKPRSYHWENLSATGPTSLEERDIRIQQVFVKGFTAFHSLVLSAAVTTGATRILPHFTEALNQRDTSSTIGWGYLGAVAAGISVSAVVNLRKDTDRADQIWFNQMINTIPDPEDPIDS